MIGRLRVKHRTWSPSSSSSSLGYIHIRPGPIWVRAPGGRRRKQSRRPSRVLRPSDFQTGQALPALGVWVWEFDLGSISDLSGSPGHRLFMLSVPGWMPQILTSVRKQSPSFLARQKSSGQVERHRFAGCGFAASEAGGLERLIHPQSFEVIRGASTHENEIERRRSRW